MKYLTSDRLLVALYGPTSSGKTGMSVYLAQRIEREVGRQVIVISADSRQVYRYMDIGTSKTTAAEMRDIRHEMFDIAEPIRKLELEDYDRFARGYIADAFAANHVPLIVGGTGVYVKALLEDWAVAQVGAARKSLRQDFPRAMAPDAYATLRRLDRAAAAQIHPNNYEGIINALASVTGAGESKAAPDREGVRSIVLGLDPGVQVVNQRVADTYDRQVRRGLFDEVQELNYRYGLEREIRQRGPSAENQVLHTHGYREYFEVALERRKPVGSLTESDLAEVRTRVIEHIRRYTRRQRSWLQKLPGVRMVKSPEQAFGLVAVPAAARR
jgi:tRNA dimethylallyltransferase